MKRFGMAVRGTFVAIEGSDGSGKGTQFKLLSERLMREGYDIVTFDFPRYDQPSSYFVHGYLNGLYGSSEEVGPYLSSLFYALDRYEAAPAIVEALEAGKVVLANRFTPSNMAHQGAKILNDEERRNFFMWVDNLEFKMMGIPRPHLSVVLRVPAELAQSLIDKKAERDYTTKKRDIHEADLGHLTRSAAMYDELCHLFPKDFKPIDCVRGGKLLPIEDIHKLLWETVQPLLPSKHLKSTIIQHQAVKFNPYIEKINGGYRLTTAGRGLLKALVTDTKGGVYGLTNSLTPATIGMAMAGLTRREDDLRTIILDEFASLSSPEKSLNNGRHSYEDIPVHQLFGQHVVVEGASNLLAKKLEWGRLASYIEPPTHLSRFDQKDERGSYKYYVPESLDEKTKIEYTTMLNKIYDNYAIIINKLTEYFKAGAHPDKNGLVAGRQDVFNQAYDVAQIVLPVAAKSTVGIYASAQALKDLIVRLLSDELPEAFETGHKLLTQVRDIAPVIFDNKSPEADKNLITYHANTARDMHRLAQEHLPNDYASVAEPVRLVGFWPKNELDLVADMLYEHSNQPLKKIQKLVDGWSYEKKQEIFLAYMGDRKNRRHKPGRALEKAHYSWDLICDYGSFRGLQRHRIVDGLAWQPLTPRYGYELPKLINEAGLDDIVQACFGQSLELYSTLQAAGYELEAQYAILFGHKMRWKLTYNARQAFAIHELHLSQGGYFGQHDLVAKMHQKLSEAHPLIAKSMKFINQGEKQNYEIELQTEQKQQVS